MITVVFALKNRDKTRVENCIKSLQDQDCRIIVVDFGSKDLSWYPEVFKKTGFISVRKNAVTFNKSRALNIAFRLVTTKYVISSDIDNIFAPNFIEEIEKTIKRYKVIALCQKIDLDESGAEKGLHPKTDYGSCFGIDIDWIKKVRGYDEFYLGWGREDDDLFERALKDGYMPVWLDQPLIKHQFHVSPNREFLKRNDKYLKKNKKRLLRNNSGWGHF